MSEKVEKVAELDPKPVVTMAIIDGMLICGILIGGNKLINPRVFNFINDCKEIQMAPLPGIPPYLRLGTGVSTYPIPETAKGMNDLYKKVTTPPKPEPVRDDVVIKMPMH